MNLKKFCTAFKLSAIKKSLGLKDRISKADFGILKVAFMVAALDGDVTDAEYKAFEALAKKCRGYTPKVAADALDGAMRSAGYLMLLSRRAKEEDLVRAFLAEAQAALPLGFAYLSIEDVRRAVVTWIAVGLSDGDYSRRERACIEALRKAFAELRVMRLQAEESRWLELSPAFAHAYGESPVRNPRTIELVSKDFVRRVEDLVGRYGDSAEAAKALEKLIAG